MRRPDRSSNVPAHRFAISLPAPRVRREAGILPASALVHRGALRPLGGEDARCVQPTSATRTNVACTRTSRVPGKLRGLRRVLVAKSLGSARHDQGRECFTTLRPRFGGSGREHIRRVVGLSPIHHDQGSVRPEVLPETVPLTPLSIRSSPPGAPSLRSWDAARSCSHEVHRPEILREWIRGRLARALVKEPGA